MPNVRVERVPRRILAQPQSENSTFLGVATGAWDRYVFVAPYDCRITGLSFVVDTTAATDGTDFWSLTIQDGATVVGAAISNEAAPFTADVARSFTVTNANASIDEGDELRLVGADNGGGSPTSWAAAYCMVTVEFEPR